MTRLSAALLVALLGVSVSTTATAGPGEDARRHYENRARFKSRVAAVEHVTVLAEGCLAARAALDDADAPHTQRDAARGYLEALDHGRAVIREINDARLSQRDHAAAGMGRVTDMRESLRMVSPLGEYLIMRDIGVFAALDDWVRSGGDFALAAALR
jgi:hypothetical protein